MHRAALQGLGLVGNRLKQREEATCRHVSPRHIGRTRRSRSLQAKNHHTGAGAEADDQDLHRRNTTIAHDMEEAEDENLQNTYTKMKMMK
jgi:hypothetical protein